MSELQQRHTSQNASTLTSMRPHSTIFKIIYYFFSALLIDCLLLDYVGPPLSHHTSIPGPRTGARDSTCFYYQHRGRQTRNKARDAFESW